MFSAIFFSPIKNKLVLISSAFSCVFLCFCYHFRCFSKEHVLSKHLRLFSARGQTALRNSHWWAELIEGQCASSVFFLRYMLQLPFGFLNRKWTVLTTLEAHELTKGNFTLNIPTNRKDAFVPLSSLEISGFIISLFIF